MGTWDGRGAGRGAAEEPVRVRASSVAGRGGIL
jgi:hypothetical protein